MKSKELICRISALYDAYIEKVNELERTKKVTDGLLGITKGPKDDPCHDKFANDLEQLLKEFAAAEPSSEEVCSLLEYMYTVPLNNRENHMVYWMFMAVHTLALDLIRCLDKADAEKLYQRYSSDYPRWERLPAQKKTLKELKAIR